MLRRLAPLAALVVSLACSSPRRAPPPRYGYPGAPPPPGYAPPPPGYAPPPPGYAPPPPQGAPPPSGQPLTEAQIKPVVQAAQPDFKACLAGSMMEDRSVSGRVVVRFVVDPSGRVSSAEVRESNLPPAMNQCVLNVCRRLTFPPHGGAPQGVVYPLSFN